MSYKWQAVTSVKSVQKDVPGVSLIPWSFPKRAWQRIHIDFAEFQGKYYLVVVDAFDEDHIRVYGERIATVVCFIRVTGCCGVR